VVPFFIVLALIAFLFGFAIGRCTAEETKTVVHKWDNKDPSDWWKRGEEPPDYGA
jgi:hypothetical protein